MNIVNAHHERLPKHSVLRVAANAVLDHDRLLIDGQRAWLSHRDDLAIVARITLPVVAPLLDELFVGVTGRPTPEGNVLPCGLPVGEQYTHHALMLYHAADPGKREEAGRSLLRWCLLAQLLVDMTAHPCYRTPAFGAIRLMLEHGACVVRVGSTGLAGAVPTAEREHEPVVEMVCLGGVASKTDQGSPEVLTVPWLGDLGLSVDDPLSLACQVLNDLLVMTDEVRVEVGAHHRMRAYPDLGPTFCRAFDRHMKETGTDAGLAVTRLTVRLTHARGTTVFRSERSRRTDGRDLYAFRRLPSAPSRFFPEAPITPTQLEVLSAALTHVLGPMDGPALVARQRARAPALADLEFWVDALVEQIFEVHGAASASAFRGQVRQALQDPAMPGSLKP